jgi:major outer membrane protein
MKTLQLLFATVLFAVASQAVAAPAPDTVLTTNHAADSGNLVSLISDGGGSNEPSLSDLSGCCCEPVRSGWFAGADYRLIRTHFSEAVAFATLTGGIGPQGPDLRVAASELRFDYRSSFAIFAGYHINDYSDVRFSYWHLDTSTGVTGAAASPFQAIVDPFGNIAPFGTTIDTTASVKLNVYDLEYLRRIEDPTWPTSVLYSAGLRFANVNQFYDSTILAGGNVASDGLFRVNWFGVGPYASLTGRIWAGSARRFSMFAKAGAALLVGKNDITTDVSVTGGFTGGQTASRILVVPVLESELGASWQPSDRWQLSAGWLVQAWFDLGVSGGTFSGANLPAATGGVFPPIQNVFGGADDSSIMAFDGLFFRAAYNY